MIALRVATMVVAACLPGMAAAASCGDALPRHARALESSHYVIVYATTPSPVEVGRHFVVDFAVCPRDGGVAPQSVRVDANMPEHRHGMNYRPGVVILRPGTYRAEGLMFHMPGRWDLTFDVVAADATERMVDTLRVE